MYAMFSAGNPAVLRALYFLNVLLHVNKLNVFKNDAP